MTDNFAGQECWLLVNEAAGARLLHGEVLSVDAAFHQTLVLLDGNHLHEVPTGSVLRTPAEVYRAINEQVRQLAHLYQQFEDAQAFAQIVANLDGEVCGTLRKTK